MPATDSVSQELQQAATTLSKLYDNLPMIITRLLTAGVAIVIGLLLLRFFRRLVNKHISYRPGTARRTMQQAETLRSLISSIIGYLMYFFIALVVLRIFGVDLTSLLAVAGIGSIAIGFGAQSLVKDIISGMFLWMEGNITVGDIVTLSGCTGRVEAMSLRTTTLRGTDGVLYAIPNGDIRTVTCRSRGQVVAQVNITVAVGQDMLIVQQVLQDECALLAERLGLPQSPTLYPAIAGDAQRITMRVECPCEPDACWTLEREIRLSLYERLRKENIRN